MSGEMIGGASVAPLADLRRPCSGFRTRPKADLVIISADLDLRGFGMMPEPDLGLGDQAADRRCEGGR